MNNTLRTQGWSSHSNYEIQKERFYSTDPMAIDYLLQHETFDKNIWECACGNGNLSKRLADFGYNVVSTDLVYRGFGEEKSTNFLECKERFDGDIITNPPYNYALEFVLKALELSKRKVAMFLKIQFLESIKRYENLFKDFPPSKILVFVKRINCYRNDDRNIKGSVVLYAWFIWDKEYDGKTILDWIDNIEGE